MDIPFPPSPEDEVRVALNILRVYAYFFIPASASEAEARLWVKAQSPSLALEERNAICSFHASGDKILNSWRVSRCNVSNGYPLDSSL